ncbi:MAG: hypothetical protein H0V70_30275 [Ktedonobacteraceae bacterium]|nr:hypothetical protein [Ktedonobacteraceae bacterium]
MPRRRRYSARRGRGYDDYVDYGSYRSRRRQRRRGGCLAPIQRFFRNVAILLLLVIGILAFFGLTLLIVFNFRIFLQILHYAGYVIAVLAVLGILYLIVRIIVAISQWVSAASLARSKAKIERERVRLEKERVQQARVHVQMERERVRQAHVQVQRGNVQIRSQEAKIDRDNYAFYQKYQQPESHPSPYQTRNLREREYQEPLVRVLPALSSAPVDPEPPEPEVSELEQMGMPAKGQIFHYKRYKKYLKSGQLFIGVRKNGSPRIGDWQDYKITLILGSSSSGKSTTVLEKCVGHVQNAGLLVVCDPGGFKPDSITQRMGALADALMPGTSVALEHEDIMQNLERFRVELERRRRGADMTTPILLIIDELNGLLMDKDIKKDLTELLEKFAQQARGYNMYMILCAQRASGLATIRNSVISFICHKCPEMEASKILPARYAKLAPELGVGQSFVSDANGYIEPLQQIYITAEDIAASVGGTQHPPATLHSHPTEPLVRNYGAPQYRQATPSQKLVLRRTQLIQHNPSPLSVEPRPSVSRSATWGESAESVPVPRQPSKPIQNVGSLDTEELAPRSTAASKQSKQLSSEPLNPFDALAALRDQQKRK